MYQVLKVKVIFDTRILNRYCRPRMYQVLKVKVIFDMKILIRYCILGRLSELFGKMNKTRS